MIVNPQNCFLTVLRFCHGNYSGIELSHKGRHWALRAPRPAPKDFVLWTPIGEVTSSVQLNYIRLSRWGYEKLVASGSRKPGKSQGESSLSPGDYSQAFPGRNASGKAAFSRRARSTASKVSLSFSCNSGNKLRFPYQVTSAIAGPGASGPWFGSGANSPSVPLAGGFIGEWLLYPVWKHT